MTTSRAFKKRVVIRDTDTSDILWSAFDMPLPTLAHDMLTVAFVFNNRSAVYEFHIDAIDIINQIVYVTLKRVHVDGVDIPVS